MHQAAGAIESTQRERGDKAIDYVFGLLDIPWWYYAIATLLGVAGWRVWGKLALGLLVFEIARGRMKCLLKIY